MIILGLGSNIGNRYLYLREAIKRLKAVEQFKIEAISPVYESDALIPPQLTAEDHWNKPFLNLAVKLLTELPPKQLLSI